MSLNPLRCVVDASVGIQLFVGEPLSDRAHELFAHLAADPPARLYVPELFYIECANILWKYVRRFGYPPDQARRSVQQLSALSLRSVPMAGLMGPALDLALWQGITAYDACYVALSRSLSIPFVTADEKLVQTVAGEAYDVHWLGDFPIPPVQRS